LRGKLFFTVLLVTISTFWKIEIPKRAFRQYEKGDIPKAIDALEKSLSKDTLNPAAHFLYAQIYIDTTFTGYHVDSAYLSINKAIDQFNIISDEDDLEDLADYGLDSLNLTLKKDLIDELKFQEVSVIHSIQAYNDFMLVHTDAIQLPEAKRRRDRIAFEDAKEMNIWQSYKAFMEEYPAAVDYNEADSLYKLLIYQDLTEDKTLKSYTSFLESYPQSPYRSQVEQQIYTFTTAKNTIEAYMEFLTEYPSDSLAAKTLPRIYHVYKEQYGPDYFLSDLNIPTKTDSIENAISLEKGYWIPKLENNRYAFIDQNGDIKLISFFDELPPAYLCEPIETDFIYGQINGKRRIQGRNGRTIFEGSFDEAIDAGYGFIKLIDQNGQRLIHKSGEVIVSLPQDEIEVMSNSFIRLKKNGFYGLTSINGLNYVETEFSAIEWFEGYLWLEKEEGIALMSPKSLFPKLIGNYVEILFEYEDLDVLDNGRIWAQKNGKEGVLNAQLQEVIPFGDYEIYEEAFGWQLIAADGITVLHDRFTSIASQQFDDVKVNDKWLAVQTADNWTLYDQLGDLRTEQFDSLELLGENMVMLFRNDSSWAQFKNGKRLLMESNWTPKLLVPQTYIKSGAQANHDYFMLSNNKNFRRIYNEWGNEILSATYQDVTALDPNMLRLQKRNTALVDSVGVFLLNFVYDGVGSNEGGYLSILDAGKVGIINPAKRLLIKPSYTKLLQPYSDTVLVANDGTYDGFINKKNKALSAFEFDEVRYWNDTVALVRIEDEWIFHDISREEFIYEGMLDYQVLRRDENGALIRATKEGGVGLYHTTKGEIIEPTFDDIKVLGSTENPIFFSLKIVEEADLYVVIYYDEKGNKLFTQSLSREAYFSIACL